MAAFRSQALRELLDGLQFREGAQSYILTCPRCQKGGKLYIRKSDGRFVCWVCKEDSNFFGRAEYVLMELLSLPRAEIEEKLYGEEQIQAVQHMDLQIEAPGREEYTPRKFEDEGQQEFVFPPDFYELTDRRAAKGRQYLEGRGIDLELAQSYGIRYCPPTRRVIFPVFHKGRLYGWQARTVDRDSWVDAATGKKFTIPKALTAEGFKKDQALMFWDRLTGSPHAVLCEGPVDALKCHLCGGNVATLGKAVSDKQIRLIRESGVQRVYLGLDPDATAESRRLAKEFADLEVYELTPAPGFKDLGEMRPEAVLERFQLAQRLNDRPRMRLFLKH